MKPAQTILSAVQHIKHDQALNEEIFSLNADQNENEFLIILKPELFVNSTLPQLDRILDLIFCKLKTYELQINNIRLINARYLNQFNVIANHYGVINAVARDFKKHITDEVASNFKKHFELEISEAKVFGALELLANKTMDSTTLNELWKTATIKRLAGGIYAGKIQIKGEEQYIINGFHPPQLEHFIAENQFIVTINVSGNTDWEIARKELIGNTYPEKADHDSIRGALYKQFGNFGFENVSYVINSIHLSAGPLEGLIELIRFNSAFKKNEKTDLADFSFGRLLQKNFNSKKCQFILSNPTVKHEGQAISLFDLTEEKNNSEAIELLKHVSLV